jgi:phosphate-selective porin OprO/OprP
MYVSRSTILALTLGAITLGIPGTTQAQTSATEDTSTTAPATSAAGITQQAASPNPEARLTQLEDRITALEKADAKAKATTATTPTVTASRDGLSVRSADNAFSFRLRGYVQSDARFFGASGPVAPGSSTFLLRRVRPVFEATAYKYFGLRLMPDFGGGQAVLYDAYLEAKPNAALNVRVGLHVAA